MNRDDEEFKQFSEFFEKLLGQIIPQNMEIELLPVEIGDCNCCFLRENGHHLAYQYTNREIAHIFICVQCRMNCKPEEECIREGCSFEDTFNKYVTNQD